MPILLAVLVNLLTLGAHGTAMAASSSHSTGGMSHGSVTNLSCISICTASAPEKLRVVDSQTEKDDDDQAPPFYLANQQSIANAFDEKHSGQTKIAVALRPPPGPPAYVLNAVLRF